VWLDENWLHLSQDRNKWRTVFDTVIELWLLEKAATFWTSCGTVSLWRRLLTHMGCREYCAQSKKNFLQYIDPNFVACKCADILLPFVLQRQIIYDYKRRLLASSCLSVRPSVGSSACNNSAFTGRIFVKWDIWGFCEKLSWDYFCISLIFQLMHTIYTL
jgi:hypothetical protein